MVGVALGNTGTGGRAESGYYHAVVETARIVNVNANDYTVDAVAEYGNRRFYDIQVMSPYFHFINGEGWYAMPEVGALCWVCQESTGLYAKHFILGYQAPHDERKLEGSEVEAGNFKANRQTLNPGDQMWRGRDENFIVLRRGGVVQIGASPANQRMYVPLGGLIRDFCFGYELQSLAGDMRFSNDSVKQQGTDLVQEDDAGNVKTRFRLRAKTIANEPEHAVILTFGSHEDDDNLRLSLQVNESGAEGAAAVANLQIDKEGTVTWTMEKNLSFKAKGDVTFESEEGDVLFKSTKGTGTFQSSGDMLVESEKGAATVKAKGTATLEGGTAVVKGKTITLDGVTAIGGTGGEPIIKGQQLVTFLLQFIEGLTNPQKPAGVSVPPGAPQLFPGLASLVPLLPNLLSQNTTK